MGTSFYVILTVTAIIHGFICCAFCKCLLTEKGYSEDRIVDWEMAGFFFGIFALIAAAGLPDRSKDATTGPSPEPQPETPEPVQGETKRRTSHTYLFEREKP